jgi:hypothetical protein
MQTPKGHPYFIEMCKPILGSAGVTKEGIDGLSHHDLQRMTFLMAKHFRCWRPVDPTMQRRVLFECLINNRVYPMGTLAKRIDRTAFIENPAWGGARPPGVPAIPSARPVRPQPRSVVFTGSAYEKAVSPWWETVHIVTCTEMASGDEIVLPVERKEGAAYMVDIFEPGGRPIHGHPLAFWVSGKRIQAQVRRIPWRLHEKDIPYSIPVDISAAVDDLAGTTDPVRVDVSGCTSRFVLVVRETRERTIEEIMDAVQIRTVYEARYTSRASDIACTDYKIPTKCPLSFARIRYPSRGSACCHDSFFDLRTFLEFQKQSGLFLCPLCEQPLPVQHLEMCDPFYRALLVSPDADFFVWAGSKFEPVVADTSRKRVEGPAAAPPAKRPNPPIIEID